MYSTIARKGVANWKLALLFTLVGAGLYSAWYYGMQPIHGWFAPVAEPISKGAPNIIPAITEYVQKRPEVVATVTFGVIGLASALQSRRQKVEAQLRQQEEMLSFNKYYEQTQHAQLSLVDENKLLKAKIEALQNSDVLGEATGQVSSLRQSYQNLQGQMETERTEHLAEVRALQSVIEQLKMAEKVVVK